MNTDGGLPDLWNRVDRNYMDQEGQGQLNTYQKSVMKEMKEARRRQIRKKVKEWIREHIIPQRKIRGVLATITECCQPLCLTFELPITVMPRAEKDPAGAIEFYCVETWNCPGNHFRDPFIDEPKCFPEDIYVSNDRMIVTERIVIRP